MKATGMNSGALPPRLVLAAVVAELASELLDWPGARFAPPDTSFGDDDLNRTKSKDTNKVVDPAGEKARAGLSIASKITATIRDGLGCRSWQPLEQYR
jgi:hypothetical protein